jgi:hypothetical protein
MKDRELLMRSVVNLMLAVASRVSWVLGASGVFGAGEGYCLLFCAGLPKLVAKLELLLKFIERQEDPR